MIQPRILTTDDGSQTLESPISGDTYHSVRGAVGESMHIYIREGFSSLPLSHIRILEVGFGSGLNAWLTARAATEQNRTVYYETIERYPIDPQIATRLEYAQDPLFTKLHRAAWNHPVTINDRFVLKKRELSLEDCRFDTTFDLIYFDAFAPDTQPELWTATIFRRLYEALSDGGVLVTYSAKGSVKEHLRSAGFTVKRRPGALGKHHMVRATKNSKPTNE